MKCADILFLLAWAFIALIVLGLIIIGLYDAHAYKV